MKIFKVQDYINKPKNKIAKRMIYKDSNVICFVLNISAGESLPEHTHFNSTVLIKVIHGNGKLNADNKITTIETNQLIQVDGQEKMSIANIGQENLVLFVTISPAPPDDKYSTDIDI